MLIAERSHWDPNFRAASGGDNLLRYGRWTFPTPADISFNTSASLNYMVPSGLTHPNIPGVPIVDVNPAGDEVNAQADGDAAKRLAAAGSMHPNGANVAFCDGSVRYLTNGISDLIWQAMSTRADKDRANYD